MTNIVGGNTGNLSQSGAGKDNVVPGFAQNSTGLDFFQLISFATENQEFSSFDGKGNSLTIELFSFSPFLERFSIYYS